jgi:DNA-binding XRE family transcriptional regulator
MASIKDFRTEKALTQEHMARKMDVSIGTYCCVERGSRIAGRTFLDKFVKAFPCADIVELFFSTCLICALGPNPLFKPFLRAINAWQSSASSNLGWAKMLLSLPVGILDKPRGRSAS